MAPDKTSNSQTDSQTLFSSLLQSLGSSISVWFLFLFCGGIIFAVYYARIGYLPDIELNSALSYLAAASIIGGSLVVLLTLLIVVPGSIWATQLTHHFSLKNAFCEDTVIIPNKFLFRLVFWLFLSAVLMHLILILHKGWMLSFFVPMLMIKGGLIRFVELPECKVGKKARAQLFLVYSFWYGVSLGSVLLAIYILFKFLGLSNAIYTKTHFGICTFGVVAAISIVAIFLHHNHRAGAFASAIFFALAIIVATDYFDRVPDKILANYGFGLEHVQMIVTEDGYRTLQAEGLAVDNPNSGARAISEVSILCRIGQNYFLKINNRKFTLRKSDVLSWSVEESH